MLSGIRVRFCGCCSGFVVLIRLCTGFHVDLQCDCVWLFYLVLCRVLGCSGCLLI